MTNAEIEGLAESLQDYRYLHTLDLSWNRLDGEAAGKAIGNILMRRPEADGYVQLSKLELSHNKLGNEGFEAILESLKFDNMHIDVLNVSYNNIKQI